MLSIPTYAEHESLADRVSALEQSQGGNTVKDFGAVGDGSDDTVAINAALNSGMDRVVFPAGLYRTNQLTIGAAVREIWGPGTIQPISDETHIFDQSGVADLTIRGLGIKGYPNGTENSNNDAIRFQDCARIRFVQMVFENCPRRPIQIDGGGDVIIAGSRFDHCSNGPNFRGVRRGRMSRNILNGSQQADSVVKVGLGINPYSATYGFCEQITIDGNIITDYGNSQGILVHAGRDIAITGNVVNECASGINLNPFDSGDDFERITINGNTCRGLKANEVTYTTNWDQGINVSGTNVTCRTISVSGNAVFGFGNVLDADPHGGITIQAVDSIAVTGNTIDVCANAGIGLFGGASTNVLIATNEITLTGGTPIKESASYTGLITDNLV